MDDCMANPMPIPKSAWNPSKWLTGVPYLTVYRRPEAIERKTGPATMMYLNRPMRGMMRDEAIRMTIWTRMSGRSFASRRVGFVGFGGWKSSRTAKDTVACLACI